MRKIFLILCYILINVDYCEAQIDTIQVSKNYKTLLIFDDDIAESIIGNDFEFFQEIVQGNSDFNSRILKLSFNRGANSKNNFTNLTVITSSGVTLDYILEAVKIPKKLTFKIDTGSNKTDQTNQKFKKELLKSEHNIESKIISSNKSRYSLDVNETNFETISEEINREPNRLDSLYKNDRNEFYRLKCFYNQYEKEKIARYFVRNGDVFFQLKTVYYSYGDIFFHFKIENKQTIDLDIDFINYSIATNYKKSSSNQETLLQPVYLFQQPETVEGESSNHFFVVFKKFTLEKHNILRIDLKEKNGARTIQFDINDELINNPIKF
ncbi:hypothetical protein FHS04_002776 [Mesoflavibacter sabulilitoris]|uniref:Conjugative transposon protein TraN n=1 Tax=Mesoflavibacter zeaxanthinifaciens subsp. sabulilitoris TaxID=1520893 RepID=A0A2T1NNJ8_9FLAO|nr:DUF4138 domain-containing protein [Mesoflavibacter zeaxanthinifaciens]MBB3125232.1 hypothetical protein [Mesoflavibacter zeaxanthinifaciens subsp. sabulilitoris]PSG94467.1 hypothetical protein C7H61_00610 [Mesoflavibacter zeaxanthinifaciens subsp. sabulilitoris]